MTTMTKTENGSDPLLKSGPFAKFEADAWPYRYRVDLEVREMHGGIPSDPKIREGYIRSKIANSDVRIQDELATIMAEQSMSVEDAIGEMAGKSGYCGFARDEHGLYIAGANLKACLKEGAMVACSSGKLPLTKWGQTNKHLKGFFAEHIMVPDAKVYLGQDEPDGVRQSIVHGRYGAALKYEEFIETAHISTVVMADYKFTDKQWAMIWLTAQEQGLGASRSQGNGRFTVTRWESE